MHHLVAIALILAQTSPPEARLPETQALLARTAPFPKPIGGYTALGEFFVENGRYDRAKQVFAYALLYSPFDPVLLGWLAEVELALSHPGLAREYAEAALRVEPGQRRASQVLDRLPRLSTVPSSAASSVTSGASPGAAPAHADASAAPGHAEPSPAPAHAEASPAPGSPAASPAPTPSPEAGSQASASPAPGPPGGAQAAALSDLRRELDVPPDTPLPLSKAGGLDPNVAGDKLAAWRVLKAIAAALAIYKLNHPKAQVKTLDLKALVEDKALPKELDLSGYPKLSLNADGQPTMEGFGSLDELESKLADYRAGLDLASRRRASGLLAESYFELKNLQAKFPKDPELLERKLRIDMELGRDFEGAKTARELFLARPSDPHYLFELGLLYYRSSRSNKARIVAGLLPRIYPDSFYTPAARSLRALVDSGVSAALMEELVAQKERLMAAAAAAAAAASTTATTSPAASPSPSGSASPAASPSPAGSASPAASPSPAGSASPAASPSPAGSASPAASPSPAGSASPAASPPLAASASPAAPPSPAGSAPPVVPPSPGGSASPEAPR